MRDPYYEFEQALTLVLMDADPSKRKEWRTDLARARINVDKDDPRYAQAVHRACSVLDHVDGLHQD